MRTHDRRPPARPASRRSVRRRGAPGGACAQAWVDVENALFDFIEASDAVLEEAFRCLIDEIRSYAPNAMVDVCGDRRLIKRLVHVTAGMRGVRLFPGAAGPDRADLELIERIEGHLCPRTDRVVIVSGDGAFVESVESLRGRGCHVTVLARTHTASCRLKVSADAFAPISAGPDEDSSEVA